MQVQLTEEQVMALKEWMDDGDGGPTSITLTYGEGHSGRGLYVSLTEYPEEGADLLVPEKS
jgi:hypothetical protein